MRLLVMTNKSFLKKIEAGNVIVRALTGGGFTTYDLLEIEHVDENGIYIEGADGDYAKDSVYRFDLNTGRSVNNYSPGFYSTLIRIATKEDLKNGRENKEITA